MSIGEVRTAVVNALPCGYLAHGYGSWRHPCWLKWRYARLRVPNGVFEASGLVRGAYYAAAFDHVVGAELTDANSLRTLAASAVSVQIDEGSTTAVQLPLNGWPE